MRYYWWLLNILCKVHVAIKRFAERSKRPLKNMMKSCLESRNKNLRWFGHVSMASGLANTILQEPSGKRNEGRQTKNWEDIIKEWTEMDSASSTRAAENKTR